MKVTEFKEGCSYSRGQGYQVVVDKNDIFVVVGDSIYENVYDWNPSLDDLTTNEWEAIS